MKKYLTLAAVLGAIAFISVSYLAQADEKSMTANTPVMAKTMPDAAINPSILPSPPVHECTPAQFKMDSDMCAALASAPTTEGSEPSMEVKDAAFKKCMIGKEHPEEELKKSADEAKSAEEAAVKSETPAAK